MTMKYSRDEVIKALDHCIHLNGVSVLDNHDECFDCPFRTDGEDTCVSMVPLLESALNLLKAQEQEISRLKHHIDCDAAEKIPSGCVGFGRGFNDDEPCETCKECEKYNLYGVE